jgi:excisionase family DNA binding protein
MNDNATQPQPRLVFSVEAAAEVLSISRTRMFALIKTGEMPSIQVGRLRRIPAGALAEYVARLTAAQSPLARSGEDA